MAPPYHFYIFPICSILTFILSIACIASKTTASRSYNEADRGGYGGVPVMLRAEFPNEKIALARYPYYLGLDATSIVLAASSIALVISVGIAGLSTPVMLKHNPIKVRLHFSSLLATSLIICPQVSWYQKQALLFLLLVNASLALAAFITSFVMHSKSEHFSLSYRSLNGGFGHGSVYEYGVFDLETWTCEVKNLPSFQGETALGQQCTAAATGRICTALVFVLAFFLFIAVWWDIKKHGSLFATKFEVDRMACDDEDDCELDDVAAGKQRRAIGFPSAHR